MVSCCIIFFFIYMDNLSPRRYEIFHSKRKKAPAPPVDPREKKISFPPPSFSLPDSLYICHVNQTRRVNVKTMQEERLQKLVEGYMTGKISTREETLLFLAIASAPGELVEKLAGEWYDRVRVDHRLSRERADAIFRRIVHRRPRWIARAAIAAGIALLLALGGGLHLSRQAPVAAPEDVAVRPATRRAVLHLSDGTRVTLQGGGTREVARDGNVAVHERDGALAYSRLPGGDAPVLYHRLATPNGAFYEVSLPDGSHAWLNAGSSIRYAADFRGGRRVEVSGEIFFDIKRVEGGAPFTVAIAGAGEVEVLGTRFNVSAYADEEATAVTLLSGSVRYTSSPGAAPLSLRPGQAARHVAGGVARVVEADTLSVLAWRDGRFSFERAEIRAISRQISPWYDVDVEFRGEITCHFGGSISRDVDITRVLDLLEHTGGVHFQLLDRRLVISP
jgi:ferric-dicitrate binding protein FerR (iron transport regulator)